MNKLLKSMALVLLLQNIAIMAYPGTQRRSEAVTIYGQSGGQANNREAASYTNGLLHGADFTANTAGLLYCSQAFVSLARGKNCFFPGSMTCMGIASTLLGMLKSTETQNQHYWKGWAHSAMVWTCIFPLVDFAIIKMTR
jgi:hypothetical protein